MNELERKWRYFALPTLGKRIALGLETEGCNVHRRAVQQEARDPPRRFSMRTVGGDSSVVEIDVGRCDGALQGFRCWFQN